VLERQGIPPRTGMPCLSILRPSISPQIFALGFSGTIPGRAGSKGSETKLRRSRRKATMLRAVTKKIDRTRCVVTDNPVPPNTGLLALKFAALD